ncbi:hypothetical protein FHU10_1859 [Serratia fonticola]|jgi:hypothetical protein|uniref:Uncharacterized protein n=1 Tax=Serratia fonticola TaxID=47917 RepID=A0A559T424_SERFO|nr:hypothetical protein [Serratia fonticola]TQI78146.1 hypothetical protein FHU09_0592 [Serratia fonticola]TQI94856.1 hypothetical protein FHU11_0200 [Serratia fonticola]TVZ69354.1 hypothetical protein FHU10_1859 [Serratia fonticola]
MKNKIVFFILLLIIISTPFLLDSWLEHRENNFSCRGKITFQKNNVKYLVQVKYIFQGSFGEVVTIGEYSELGQKPRVITQDLSFNYSRIGNEFTMVSTQSLLTESQAKILNSLVPDFYLYKDRGFRIEIHKQGKNGLVFTTASLPIFICTLQ